MWLKLYGLTAGEGVKVGDGLGEFLTERRGRERRWACYGTVWRHYNRISFITLHWWHPYFCHVISWWRVSQMDKGQIQKLHRVQNNAARFIVGKILIWLKCTRNVESPILAAVKVWVESKISLSCYKILDYSTSLYIQQTKRFPYTQKNFPLSRFQIVSRIKNCNWNILKTENSEFSSSIRGVCN